MNQYTYFILGIILGLSIALYLFSTKEEKKEEKINIDKRIFSTPELDSTMKNIVERISYTVKELERELTKEEKNKIILQCFKNNFQR